ncbi:MAG TPA: DUF1501 domain-containing protein [Planctomycetota bacterium]
MCSRRDFLRVTVAASGLGFMPENGKAKNCILLWMSGAMSQIDTFDLKPGNGPFKEIETAARGVRICEHLPRTAKRMDKVSLIRTLNSRDPNHDTASYLLHTGYRQNSDLRHPHLGSIVLEELGPGKTDLPGCVVLGGDPPAGSAYLPAERNPAVFDKLDNPGEDVVQSAEYFPKGTLDRRWSMLKAFDEDWVKAREDARLEGRRRAYERAWKILSSRDLKAFDLSQEPEDVRKAYGPTPYGKALLLSRRLVQAGVRFVEVQYGGWDSHADNFTTHQRLMTDVDGPYAALLDDLGRTGMLSETMVVLMSEFGRTPRINPAKGRDHWTRNWCAALAGGGIQGGRVIGKTDPQGMDVAERPVSVNDLFATLYHGFGVKTGKEYMSGGGRPIRILDGGEPVQELF